jgi:mono/diheme cytochrome c family protein
VRRGATLVGLAVLGWAVAPTSAWGALDPAALYRRHCAVCHGADGAGNGPAAGLLTPRPAGFRSGTYKYRSTPSGTLPDLADLRRVIGGGLPGTSMPAFAGLLDPEAIDRLAAHVLALAPASARPGSPLALGSPAPPSAEAVRQGRQLYRDAGCADCHGDDGRARDWRPSREGPGMEIRPRDLSEPWTFRGGRDETAIVRAILTGMDAGAMPAYADALTPAEARDLAAYVRSLARRPLWEESDPAAVRTVGVAADPLDRGRYLVNAMLCPLCHTPIDPDTGAYLTSGFLAGGMRVSAYPWGVWYSRNLTPDPETGLGGWSEAEIVDAVTRGVGRGGRRLDPMAMPWPWFARLTPEDARAIATYLRAVPAIRNPVPLPERVPVVEAVGGKLLALAGAEVAVEFWGGNAAADPALRGPTPASPGRRTAARVLGWSALALALGLVALGVPRRRHRPHWPRRRDAALAAGLLGLAGWATLAVWPPLGLMTPEQTVAWLLRGTPGLPAGLSGAERARAARGEYVATIAPCGLCHTPALAFVGFDTRRTLAGGMEGRWRVYGSAVATNLTPHPRDGIAGIADAALLRAMQSGIGADGRALHWQAMPWDIGSHWSEEDLRAIVAYLRALPPVAGVVPPPRGPRPGDPPADAFYFGDAARR